MKNWHGLGKNSILLNGFKLNQLKLNVGAHNSQLALATYGPLCGPPMFQKSDLN